MAETVEDPRFADALAGIWDAYQKAEIERGLTLGRTAVVQMPEHGELWFGLACCLERAGDLMAADRAFSRATRCTVDPQPLPYRVGWPRFQRAVEEASARLPKRLRDVLGEVTLILADYAEPELIASHGEPELLGLFEGVPRGDRLSPPPGSLSPRIHLFRRAHEHNSSTAQSFAAEVTQTLYHELGHYIGYDEDGLDELGMG
ncbi:MAG: metallopeptidase family protein [Planctomycetes bacterium]|nr:metallopeptidase family protein [Planctomycetota bacterium]